jgi:hypothetical protein
MADPAKGGGYLAESNKGHFRPWSREIEPEPATSKEQAKRHAEIGACFVEHAPFIRADELCR